MTASSASRRASAAAQPAPRRAPATAPQRANLKVAEPAARSNDRVWPAMTIVSTIAIGIAFVVAGLFAGDIQIQAEIDQIKREISELREERVEALAERAWHDSPEGLTESAVRAGLVPAAGVAPLAPPAPGLLEPPGSVDPFTPTGAPQR